MKKIYFFLKISVKKCAGAGVRAGAKNSVRVRSPQIKIYVHVRGGAGQNCRTLKVCIFITLLH